MNKPFEDSDFADPDGVEALLAAAGGYVGPSDDLRPRVLEGVEQHRRRTLVRRRLSVAAGGVLLVALVVGLQAATLGNRLAASSTSERVARLVESSSEKPYHSGVEELCWRLVDAVLAVRSEQAAALGSEE